MHRHELTIPPAVHDDPNGFELLRVWAAHNSQHVSIHSGLNGGAGEFGILLADLLQHAARLYSERQKLPVDVCKREILKVFGAELTESSTGDHTGTIHWSN